MAQTSLNSTGVASSGALSLQSNGTTEAIGISTGQVATLAQNPILTSGTANGVAYLNGSKVLTTGSALVFDGATLGLGTAPSAWNSSVTNAVQLKNGYAALSSNFSIGYGNFSCNAYEDGNDTWKYVNSQPATRYRQNISGVHAWFNAPSGTAGNAITFTQAMTLDASGNLGVGTTTTDPYSLGSTGKSLALDSSNSSTGSILSLSAGGTRYGYLFSNSSNVVLSAYANIPLLFSTNNTERARIDSSGRFMVGTTNTSPGSGSAGTIISPGDGGILLTANTDPFLRCYSLNGGFPDRLQIANNGNITNANNSYGGISDIKLKENITDATSKLNGLLQVRVVNYNLKTDPTHKQIGVIAQELEQVFPGMVDETPDTDSEGNETGETTKSVKYSVFVPMLIKAIQEQQALITSLTARIEALEA
jgi:hypothetical protein